MKTLLNASEVAKLLKVDRATVARWIKRGLIKGVTRRKISHYWRIPLSSYVELVEQNE